MSDPENNIKQFVRVLIQPFADFELAAQQVLTQRSVDNAIGAQLDVLGRLVGQPRNGVTDDALYRRYVRARIAANVSDGTIEDAIRIAKCVIALSAAVYVVDNIGAGGYVLRVEGVSTPEDVANVLIQLLRDGTAGGCRVILESSRQPPARWARFDLSHFDDDNARMIAARDRVLP